MAGDLGRLEAGRELFRWLAPGRVLAVEAVRGLAVAPFLAVPPVLGVAPFLAAPDLLAPPTFAPPTFAPPTFAPPSLAVLSLAVLPLGLAEMPDLAVLAFDLEVPDFAGLRFGLAEVPAFGRAPLPAARADLAADDRADDAAALGLAASACLGRADADRAEASGLATDIVFAAEVRALAAAVIALVAVFMDCIAVDIVLADEVARVVAAVILVAAEVTLVAADDTVRAAVADVGAAVADEVFAVPVPPARRAVVPRAAVRRAAVLRAAVLLFAAVLPVLWSELAAVPAAERAVVLPVDLAAVPRVDDLAPVGRARAVVFGRSAERFVTLVLTDRVLPELAGLRRAGARVVVCTGTDFPPS